MPCAPALLKSSGTARTPERKMPVRVLIAVLIVLFVVCLRVAAARAVRVLRRERRRREVGRRLAAATAEAEARDRQRKAAERASGALTSVMPTIHDIETRHVSEPGPTAQ